MGAIKSWTVSESLWKKIAPLIPSRQRAQGTHYQRKLGAGRKPKDAQVVFSAIVYVLRTGCQWKALPREFGSASSVHKYFQRWHKAGFFFADMAGRAGRIRRDGGYCLGMAVD
jgi:transposase